MSLTTPPSNQSLGFPPSKQIKRLSRSGRFGEAENIGRSFLQTHPDTDIEYPKVCTSLTTAYVRARLFREAEELGQLTVQKFPKDPFAHNSLVQVLLTQNKLCEAEELGQQTVQKFPDNPVAHTSLVQVFLAQNKLREAEKLGQLTVQKFPKNPVANVLLAIALIRMGNQALVASRVTIAEQYLTRASEIFTAKLLPQPFHPTTLHIARRLAEHHKDCSSTGVNIPINNILYNIILDQCTRQGININSFQLRRNSIHLGTEELENSVGVWVRSKMWQDSYFEYGQRKSDLRPGVNRVAIRITGQPEPYVHK